MKLLYVGKNYPGFVAEAQRLGVSRNIPLSSLKNLEWGDEILCATFHTYGKHEDSSETKKDGSLRWPNGKPVNLGEARVLCSFAFHGITIKDPGLCRRVQERLWQDGFVSDVLEGGLTVDRGCGSYSIGAQAVVTASIEEIYQIILEVKEELDIKVVKIMIGGPIRQIFPAGSGFYDAKFTRNLVDVDAANLGFEKRLENEGPENRVIRIHKYQTTKKGTYQEV